MAKANPENKPGHITTSDVLEDLGFTAEEIRETEIKMTIWRPLRAEIEARGLTQVQIANLLQMHQPDASLLVRGRLEKFSVMRLMQFAERLGLTVQLMVKPSEALPHGRPRGSRSQAGQRRKVSPAKLEGRTTAVARQTR
jgi:predicted XRE-type DNA-binding protein